MNYSDAVKELVTNPKADSIRFKQHSSGKFLHIKLDADGTLRFVNSPTTLGSTVKGCSADFITRNDFEVVYKRLTPLRMSHKTKCNVLRVEFSVHNFQAAMFLVRVLSLDESVSGPVLQYLQQNPRITVLITSNQFASFITYTADHIDIKWSGGELVEHSDDNVFDLT